VRKERTELESLVVFPVHGSDAVMAVLVTGKRRPLELHLGRVSAGRASMVSRRRRRRQSPWKLVHRWCLRQAMTRAANSWSWLVTEMRRRSPGREGKAESKQHRRRWPWLAMRGSDAGDYGSRGSARWRLDEGCGCSSSEEAEKGYDV